MSEAKKGEFSALVAAIEACRQADDPEGRWVRDDGRPTAQGILMAELRRATASMTEKMVIWMMRSQSEAMEKKEVSSATASFTVKTVNEICRAAGLCIAHPDDGEGCFLVNVTDQYGYKFGLENRKTKKRTCFRRSLSAYLPIRLIPIPMEPFEIDIGTAERPITVRVEIEKLFPHDGDDANQ